MFLGERFLLPADNAEMQQRGWELRLDAQSVCELRGRFVRLRRLLDQRAQIIVQVRTLGFDGDSGLHFRNCAWQIATETEHTTQRTVGFGILWSETDGFVCLRLGLGEITARRWRI